MAHGRLRTVGTAPELTARHGAFLLLHMLVPETQSALAVDAVLRHVARDAKARGVARVGVCVGDAVGVVGAVGDVHVWGGGFWGAKGVRDLCPVLSMHMSSRTQPCAIHATLTASLTSSTLPLGHAGGL